jgi:hypothetical protein
MNLCTKSGLNTFFLNHYTTLPITRALHYMCNTVLECLSEIKHGGVTLTGKTLGDLFFDKKKPL